MADLNAVNRIYRALDMPDDAFSYLAMPQVYVLMPHKDSLFLVVPSNEVSFEAHTHIIGKRRGRAGIQDARDAVSWMFTNTHAKEIHGFTPVHFKHALRFNLLAGFTQCGIMPQSCEYNGRLYDRAMFTVSRKEWESQQ